jgi:hypothetical protein
MVIDQDWHQFGPAFAEAVRPGETRSKSFKRLVVFAFVAVLAAVLNAVVYGALTAKGSAAAAHPAAKPIAVSPSAAGGATADGPGESTWTAVAGPTCSNGAARFAVDGYYRTTGNGQSAGWITSSSGGYRGDGCSGGFMSVPLSGQPTAYDANRYTLWTFRLSAGFSRGTCELYTFIPYNPQIAYVGGNPAYYFYYGTDYSPSSKARPLGGYMIDQVSTRGDWVSSGSFKVTTGWVTVKMVDVGANQTRATLNAHAAAAQMRLTCHAAS